MKHLQIRTKTASGRDTLLDFLRGGAMILVLLHHSEFPFGRYILAFHMPLFFVLSGYMECTLKKNTKPFKEYVLRKLSRLVVPYFTFEAVNLIIWCIRCRVTHQPLPGIESIVSIVTCINNTYTGMYGRLWFLPCMFVADLYVWAVLKVLHNKKAASLLCAFLFFALSFVTAKIISFRLPFTIDTALFAAAFILLGVYFCDQIKMLLDSGNNACKIALLICSLAYYLYALLKTDAGILMYINTYGEYTVSICAAICGCVVFLITGSYAYRVLHKLRFMAGFVVWYGQNSLAAFPVHLTIIALVHWYFPVLCPWYILFFVTLLLTVPIVCVISRWCPWMLGKFGKFSKRRS